MNKEFSIARWIWGTGIALVLAGVIGWFNVRQFEIVDAIPYLVVLGFIASISIWLNKYCESRDAAFRTAAFGAIVVLLLIMAINAAYSFSAMRELSLARKADAKRQEIVKETEHQKTEREKEKTKQITSIATGAGRRAKYELAKSLNENATASETNEVKSNEDAEQSAFKKYESPLFWLMVIEAVAAGLCFVLMSGLKSLRQQSAQQQPEIEPVHYMTREEWDALSRAFPPAQAQQPEQQVNDEERERWKEIAQRRREYGDQLRKTPASKSEPVPVRVESTSKTDDQLVNGKYRSH